MEHEKIFKAIEYKGYVGTVEYSKEDGEVFHGQVLGVRDSITYEGATFQELVDDFHNAIDQYIDITLPNKQ